MGKLFCAVMENLTLFLQLLLTSCYLFQILVVSMCQCLRTCTQFLYWWGKKNLLGKISTGFSSRLKTALIFIEGRKKRGPCFFNGLTSSDSIKHLHSKLFTTEIQKNSGLYKNTTVLKGFPVISLQHFYGHKILMK